MGWICCGIGCLVAPFISSSANAFFLEPTAERVSGALVAFFASFAGLGLACEVLPVRLAEAFSEVVFSAETFSEDACWSCLAIESASQAFFALGRPFEGGRLCHSAEPASPPISAIDRLVSTE